jgi:hypothetical protein
MESPHWPIQTQEENMIVEVDPTDKTVLPAATVIRLHTLPDVVRKVNIYLLYQKGGNIVPLLY